tara:strand:- start:78 stop:638 length:561 start_codon:yes stop_codon:yes gene_type:complete
MTEYIDENLIKQRMDKALISFQGDLNSLRAGRASVNMLDPISVEVYGSKLPINQIGNISSPEPRLLLISIWDASNVQPAEKAIRESNLGLNPMIEGNLIRIPIPALSEDRRKELNKIASRYAENSRIAIRNIRRDIIEDIRKKEKSGEISQDEKHKSEERVQLITDEYISNIEKIFLNKEKEILDI